MYYSQKDISLFEEFKRAVLCINNNYQKRIQDNKNKLQANCLSQYYASKLPKQESTKNPQTNKKIPKFLSTSRTLSRPIPLRTPTSNILGVDDWLTPLEQQHYMSLGLCLQCKQFSHLARVCPKQILRSCSSLGAHIAQLEPLPDLTELPKK